MFEIFSVLNLGHHCIAWLIQFYHIYLFVDFFSLVCQVVVGETHPLEQDVLAYFSVDHHNARSAKAASVNTEEQKNTGV